MQYEKGDVIYTETDSARWIIEVNSHIDEHVDDICCVDLSGGVYHVADSSGWGTVNDKEVHRRATLSEMIHLQACKSAGKYVSPKEKGEYYEVY